MDLTQKFLLQFLDWVTTWIAQQVIDKTFDLLAATSFTSPDVTSLPAVRDMASRAAWVVSISYVLAIIAAGAISMARDTLQARYSAAELAPRLVVGFVASALSQPILRAAITATNALVGALTSGSFSGRAVWTQLHETIHGALDGGNGQITGLMALAVAVMVAVLSAAAVAVWILRFGLLVVLAGLAPVALATLALPRTDAIAKLWARSLGGCLAVQVLQSVLLYTATRLLTSPKANLHGLGMPGTLMNLFVVIAVLWATVKIPSIVSKTVIRGTPAGGGVMSSVLRVVVLQRVTGAVSSLARAARGARSAGRAASAAGTRRAASGAASRAAAAGLGRRP
ncbi:hypothetical protein [Actinocatenispora rupis]|uniref:TrbL/VirB6 plasmid conjugal transfer protein n=1 Tax=Actinocatenispora rupis TaxID=519421 RepID=A0A8J3NCA7_9ACTN|nr:hypothetical protein [Actinocatenispora rupis]GID10229.1 hypothetical protein Aru02nite_11180 [Actinocatenispora rupis]